MSRPPLTDRQQARIARRQQRELGDARADGSRLNGRVISHFGRQLEVEPLAVAAVPPTDGADGCRETPRRTADTFPEGATTAAAADHREMPRRAAEPHPEGDAAVAAVAASHREAPLHCHQRANLPDIVTGDYVTWQPDGEAGGVITARGARRNVFARFQGKTRRTLAANFDLVLILIAPLPRPVAGLLDRYLVATEALGVPAWLLCNKIDLTEQSRRCGIDDLLATYQALGYPARRISAATGAGTSELEAELAGKTALLVGQSGVGKSSLINLMAGAQVAATGDLSRVSRGAGGRVKGTHTTTSARLHHLGALDVIDSPGIREFGLAGLSADDVFTGFVEFRHLAGRCKYRNCSHGSEPGCALRAAMASGTVSRERVESYFQILRELANSGSVP